MLRSITFRFTLAAVAWLIITTAVVGVYFWQWLQTERPIDSDKRVFIVEKGQGIGQVAQELAGLDLLRWPIVWRAYARFLQPATIKAGEYALQAYESPLSLLTLLQGGEVISYNLTFAEGLTLKEWQAILAQDTKLKVVAGAMTPFEISLALEIGAENPEGWFFPDTYRFEKGDSDLDILKRAHEKMKMELGWHWSRRQPSLPYDSPYEALIMASIIEEETGAPNERQQIAGVFVRRLKKNMRLQTDPTVIYGMGDIYKGRIGRADLKAPTPYNTYIIAGLPPTPISNPGLGAIVAALNPSDEEHLYFVAKGDGSHHFSTTLQAHNMAVKKYQLKRRADYTSTLKTNDTPQSSAAFSAQASASSSSLSSIASSRGAQ
jgi:UPF0755 protein